MPTFPESIIIVDNQRREKRERVESVVTDVAGETVFLTVEGLNYATDSLRAKRQEHLVQLLARVPAILMHPDIVIWHYASADDALLYYKRLYVPAEHRYRFLVAVVKVRKGIKFLYNFHLQASDKVKGHGQKTKPEIWYIHPKKRKRQFGL